MRNLGGRETGWRVLRVRRQLIRLGLLAAAVAGDPAGWAEDIRGLEFPLGTRSFADSVIGYTRGAPQPETAYRGALNAIGAPDQEGSPACASADGCGYVSLGSGGSLTLGFVDNRLAGDGTPAADLWVFEVGPLVEVLQVEVSADGTTWLPVGEVVGDRNGIDLDAQGFGPTDYFGFVRLADDPESGGMTGVAVSVGIDAVGAISGVPWETDFAARRHTKLIAWGQYVSAFGPTPPGESLAAIDHAYSVERYDGVEMDLRVTGDGVPVLLHDDVIATPGGSFVVSQRTYAELQQFSLGTWRGEPVRIPRFEDALRVNGNRGRFLADMRIPATHAGEVRAAVARAGFDEHLLEITAYTISQARSFKALFPDSDVVVKQYLFPGEVPLSQVDELEAAGLDGLMLEMPENLGSSRELADYLHWKGMTLTLFVHYARNTPAELRAVVEDGVDYALTMHSGYRELLAWPAAGAGSPIELRLEPAKRPGWLSLSWHSLSFLPLRLQRSNDGFHWTDLRFPVDVSGAPGRLAMEVPVHERFELFRLSAH